MLDLGEFTTVVVKFDMHAKGYTYKTDISFKVGDYAVVEVRGVYKIVQVTAVHKTPRLETHVPYKYKWIVSKVDIDKYESLLAKEKQMKPALDYTTREYDNYEDMLDGDNF